ncbi:MAG: CRISPR-associated endonuclease/helicase Cas3 [Verrucomicrobiales bacterium]|jgi:CRISPR-associated endonuclease/helicase Cas3
MDAPVSIDEARNRAKTALNRLRFIPASPRADADFESVFRFPVIRPLQRAALDAITQPGLYVVEAPMGEGKTEAALGAAFQLIRNGHANGLYFALPTKLTSDRIHRRIQPYLSRFEGSATTLRLAHGASWLEDDSILELRPRQPEDDPEAEGQWLRGMDWFRGSKRALLSRYGVGTIDQALLGAIAVKHFFVRIFALAGKVVILDEVHSYDVYTGELLNRLIELLLPLDCTVIVLSATLTERHRQQLLELGGHGVRLDSSAEPVRITGVARDGATVDRACEADPDLSREVVIEFAEAELADLLERAAELANAGACVLWIRNTVKLAQEAYCEVMSHLCDGGEVGLLHSRFLLKHRKAHEDDWLERLKGGRDSKRPEKGCILVGTQVVEQSVDLDADFLITDLAPSDMMLQRLGRLWRKRATPRPAGFTKPQAWIVPPPGLAAAVEANEENALREALGPHAKVYAPHALLRAHAVWRELETVSLPHEIHSVLEQTYADGAFVEIPGFEAEHQERVEKLAAIANSAKAVWSNPAVEDDESRHTTRYIDIPTINLVLVRAIQQLPGDRMKVVFEGAEIEFSVFEFSMPLARALFENTVPVSLYQIPKEAREAERPEWMSRHSMNSVMGFWEKDGVVHFNLALADQDYHPCYSRKVGFSNIRRNELGH